MLKTVLPGKAGRFDLEQKLGHVRLGLRIKSQQTTSGQLAKAQRVYSQQLNNSHKGNLQGRTGLTKTGSQSKSKDELLRRKGTVYKECLMAEIKGEWKRFLMKVKEESEKSGLKLSIQKTKIMVSGCITSWQMDGEAMETVTDFIFLGFKISVDADCSHHLQWFWRPPK